MFQYAYYCKQIYFQQEQSKLSVEIAFFSNLKKRGFQSGLIKGFQNNLFLSKLEQTGTSKMKRFSIDGLHVFKLFDNFVTLAYNMRSLRNRQQRTGGNMCPTTVVANQTV